MSARHYDRGPTTRARVTTIVSFGVSPSTGTAAIADTSPFRDTTRANAVYLPSSERQSPVQMKNDVDPLPGSSPRAIETMPGTFGVVGELRREVVHELLLLRRQRLVAKRERAGLDHEVRHDAVDADAVVDAGLGQTQEAADGFGRLVGQDLELDLALRSSRARRDTSRVRAGVSSTNGSPAACRES